MPVLPLESVKIRMLRVKKGPCAPLRFSNMLSRPATGMTRNCVMDGVWFVWGMARYKLNLSHHTTWALTLKEAKP
jgi:hypothetical protein